MDSTGFFLKATTVAIVSLCVWVNMCLDVLLSKESDLSQLNPSTFSLHWQRPVWTSHSWVLPDGLQEQGL